MIKCYYSKINLIKDDVFEALSKEERYAAITNTQKRKEKIARDMLFDYVVKKEKVKPDISYNKYGKPDFIDKKYHFNLSHSCDGVVMAFSDTEVGIDLQKITSYSEEKIDKLASRIYNDNDYNYFDTDDNITFTQIWTIKEAYLKYIGVGLVKNLHDVEIDYVKKTVSYERDKEAKYAICYYKDYIVCIVSKNMNKALIDDIFNKKIFYNDNEIFDKE